MYMNADMRKKRVEILNKIDALTPKCNCVTATESENCSNCKEIQKYRKSLMGLVRKRRKVNASIDIEPVKSSNLPLTKAEYLKLKRDGKSDKEIAAMLKVSAGTIQNWKRLNNIKTERLKRKVYKKNVN